MRKLMFALALVGLSTSATAQETEVPSKKYSVATNSFWANWYVSAGANYNAAYSSQDFGVSRNPFSDKRGTFGFEVAVGKWFTPGLGLRTKFQGIGMKRVDPNHQSTFDYWNLHEDVTFNLSNMLFGYNEKRVWNFIPYVGIGVARNMCNNIYDISYNAGLLNNFRVADKWNIYFEIYINAIEGSFDNSQNDRWSSYMKNKPRHWDKNLGASVGLTYNLGKSNWEKAPDVDALMAMNKEQMDALNSSLKEQQDENARLRDMLANQKPQVVKDESGKKEIIVSTPQSVFFNIGSSRIASRKDLVNVKEVAEYAKANNRKIVVTGYADSKTESPAFNKTLGEKRANAVANELVKMGVNRDNIIVEGKGGVNTISPFSYNRRATVQLQ